MRVKQVEEPYGAFPNEALTEMIKAASEVMETAGVVA
jgi:hypothetical protein